MNNNAKFGKVSISPRGPFVAGSRPTIVLTYTTGGISIKPGGSVRFNLPPDSWTTPVYLDSIWRQYYKLINVKVDVDSEDKDVDFHISYDFDGVFSQFLIITLKKGSLKKGDKLTLIYGYKEYGGKGIRVQTFPEEDLGFVDENFYHKVFDVLVRPDKKNDWTIVDNCPRINVIAGNARRANLVVPSMVKKGREYKMKVSLLDDCRNRPSENYEGILNIATTSEGTGNKKRILEFTEKDKNRKETPIVFNNAGVNVLEAFDKEGKIKGVSNPSLSSEDAGSLQIYWGDIHGHSKLSDGAGTPEEYYQYARDMANFDICSLTDHEVCFDPEKWAKTQKLAEDYYAPDEFVTFKAFEWTSNINGHYNVYYRENKLEPPLGKVNPKDVGFFYKTDVLFNFLKGKDVLIIPHHTLVATSWDAYDPREKLAEIYSCWGRSEYPGNPGWDKKHNPWGGVQNALNKGYKLGIIAGSDTHDGLPGRCFPGNRASNLNYKGGIVAVYATRLTRDSIFESLFNRHCYGTTGERIILDFKIDGYRMGEEIAKHDLKPPSIEIKTAGTSEISMVEIVRNNKVIKTYTDKKTYLEYEYEDNDFPGVVSDDGCVYYYVRVTQADGNMAWSSPIWLEKKD